jgi:hypothetical protein
LETINKLVPEGTDRARNLKRSSSDEAQNASPHNKHAKMEPSGSVYSFTRVMNYQPSPGIPSKQSIFVYTEKRAANGMQQNSFMRMDQPFYPMQFGS